MGKNARNNFSRNTRIVQSKNGKKLSKKSAKNVFYIHTNIVTKKWGEKNARNNFCRITRIVRAKNFGKKIVSKSAKTRFLYSHEYRGQKMGGKKARNNFSLKNTNSASKKCCDKKSS